MSKYDQPVAILVARRPRTDPDPNRLHQGQEGERQQAPSASAPAFAPQSIHHEPSWTAAVGKAEHVDGQKLEGQHHCRAVRRAGEDGGWESGHEPSDRTLRVGARIAQQRHQRPQRAEHCRPAGAPGQTFGVQRMDREQRRGRERDRARRPELQREGEEQHGRNRVQQHVGAAQRTRAAGVVTIIAEQRQAHER
jgi:hypothetical protein